MKKGQSKCRQRYTCLILVLILIVGLVLQCAEPIFATAATPTPGTIEQTGEAAIDDDTSFQAYPNPPIDLLSPHVLVLDAARGMTLYQKAAEDTLSIPLVGQLMTLVLALENLQPDQTVTISRDAAALGASDSISMNLQAGEQVRVDFLIRALHYNDSQVARLSLAEAVSQTEDRFLERMRTRASDLGLTNTTFTTLPGTAVGWIQQSTLKDTAALLRHALTLPFYQTMFHQRTYTHFDVDGGRNFFFNNPLESSWTIWSNNTVNGSAYATAGGQESSAYAAVDNNIEILFLFQAPAAAEGQPIFETSRFNQDVSTLTSEIFSFYDTTVLLRQYQPLSQSFEIDGVLVPLISLQTINYVHPQGDPSIRQMTLVSSTQTKRLPVSQYEQLGQAVYTLSNGTILSADVGAQETIYPTETVIDRFFVLLATYPSLVRLILALTGILGLLALAKAVRFLFRKYYERQLKRLEKPSKKSSRRT